ncbi:hypothetical protein V2G26_009724 [Clonostachys chloroleuca]|uniref:Major facilitator superfamily (MFS) profile domain-containing protein n=1 Tax=Clonostachys chloroleuca TaxID=1926264 RepID=A0AA35PY99_9HYPO|nr:unnamed protein product [Clonostachys chloroleuca]
MGSSDKDEALGVAVHVGDEENIKAEHDEHTLPKPDSIATLNDEELNLLKKRMVRKMDLVIMPIMGILYILNYVDRSALAATKVYGIMEDLGMDTAQFATAISILFVGYIPFQIPSNLIMTKITRPGFYICSAAVIWGAVSSCTAAVKTYQQLLVVRVFLGVTEAVFFPGVIYFLSAWYTKHELGKRLAALFMFQMVGSAFGGFVAAGCLTLDGRYGIAGWRWLFIVEGVVTIGCGLIFACFMPEYPHNARLLKPEERDFAVWRLECEAGAGEAHEETTAMGGFKLALLDPKVWALVWCMHMSQAMGSTVNFFPSIVQTLGYDKTNTMLLTAPPFILAAIVFYIISYISDRKDAMYVIIISCLGVGCVAYVIPLATVQTAARYVSMMLMPAAAAGPQIMLYKTLNLHMARPFSKRSVGTAMINSIGGLSNIWASYLYFGPPQYTAAFACVLGCAVSFFLTITTYRWHVRKLNRLLGGTEEEQRRVMKKGVTQQQVDLGWRYIGY